MQIRNLEMSFNQIISPHPTSLQESKRRKILSHVPQTMRFQFIVSMFLKIRHITEIRLCVGDSADVSGIRGVHFRGRGGVLGIGDRGGGKRESCETQLFGPFLAAEDGPEEVLFADLGKQFVHEADGLEVSCGQVPENVVDH
jgi:hypothetical protein